MGKREKKKKQRKHPKLMLALKITMLILLLMTLVVTLLIYNKFGPEVIAARDEAVQLVNESTVDTFRATETSLVYDQGGRQIAVLKGDKDVYYVQLEDIPQAAIDAMVVTEDKKFFQHKGIDVKAIAAAFLSLVRNSGQIKRGASTITQQLARNVFLSHAVTWTRKVKEIFISLHLEKKYTKNQLMEFYLNNIYFANGYYGIEAASRGYFNKSCNELDLAEITFICSIPNSPTRYDPIEKFENTDARKVRILDQMLADNKITDVEYNEAYNYTIELDIPEVKKKNYVETYVMYSTVRALMKAEGFVFKNLFSTDAEKAEYDESYGEMYSQCQQSLYRSGYRIYTSIDMKKQRALQKSINEELEGNKEKGDDGIYEFQGAGVCIDNDTGRVVAAVGGRSQSITGYTFNRAYQSFRQPGSAVKPILVYGPAFERGYSPTDIIKDEAIEDGPKNSNGKYQGNMTLRRAVEQSTNTIAWKLFEELSPAFCLNYLFRMNFSKISKNDYNLAASLGGLTNGVSPLEMASAYATLENSGIYREPTCIISISDSDGNVIVNDSIFEEKQIYSEETAAAMTDVLSGVLVNGTGRGFALSGMPCAGKTGTTNEKKDGWFAGYTPYYTTVIWVGNDIPVSIPSLLGNTYPARIWNQYMSQLHEGLEYRDFDQYINEKELYTAKPTVSPEPEEEEEQENNEPDDMGEEEDDLGLDSNEDEDLPITPPVTDQTPTQPVVTNVPTTPVPVPTEAPIAPVETPAPVDSDNIVTTPSDDNIDEGVVN